jgi:hypothetical protein
MKKLIIVTLIIMLASCATVKQTSYPAEDRSAPSAGNLAAEDSAAERSGPPDIGNALVSEIGRDAGAFLPVLPQVALRSLKCIMRETRADWAGRDLKNRQRWCLTLTRPCLTTVLPGMAGFGRRSSIMTTGSGGWSSPAPGRCRVRWSSPGMPIPWALRFSMYPTGPWGDGADHFKYGSVGICQCRQHTHAA